MSRIGEALRRAGAIDQAADDRIDDPVLDHGRKDIHDAWDLTHYAAETPSGLSAAPEITHQLTTAAARDARREPVRCHEALKGKLVIGAEIPLVAIEQYRRLAGTLHDLQLQHGIKTLMVTSSLPREGKTLSIANLALTLSQSYRLRVLLVDADLRHPSVHELFGLPNKAGLADVVRTRGRSVPLVDVSDQLSVLTAGQPDANPLAQLTSSHVKDFLHAAAQQFDWVLVDTPPIGLISDAQLVARLCQAALFVVSAGNTPYRLVQRGLEELGADRVVGIVLNRMEQQDLPNRHQYGQYYETGRSARP